jgi:hypothetical protein
MLRAMPALLEGFAAEGEGSDSPAEGELSGASLRSFCCQPASSSHAIFVFFFDVLFCFLPSLRWANGDANW